VTVLVHAVKVEAAVLLMMAANVARILVAVNSQIIIDVPCIFILYD